MLFYDAMLFSAGPNPVGVDCELVGCDIGGGRDDDDRGGRDNDDRGGWDDDRGGVEGSCVGGVDVWCSCGGEDIDIVVHAVVAGLAEIAGIADLVLVLVATRVRCVAVTAV
jgi:hypothetical protein